MGWELTLLCIFGSLLVLMASGLPVAFSFLIVDVIGVFLLWGGGVGLEQLILSLRASVATFVLLPVMLFILMGEVMFHSGIAPAMINALDKWLGRIPGRLGLLVVGSGALLGSLTGNSMASTAMLGSALAPEMNKYRYEKNLSLGCILGSGGLSIMIPPSSLAVVIGALGRISIGQILVGIIIPALLMAALFAAYIIIRCWIQPSMAPPPDLSHIRLRDKLTATIHYVLPVGFVIFMCIGVIFLGIATPTEAAATGALSTFLLAAFYGKLNWELIRKSFSSGLQISVMCFMILVGSTAFSQILSFSGASKGLVNSTLALPLPAILIFMGMQVIILFMGMFMESVSIMMITIPLFMPIITALDINPLWFAVIALLNIQLGGITPPFGLGLFVLKGVVTTDVTILDIYRATIPFLILNLVAMALLIAFPGLVTWLPGVVG